MKTSQEDGVQDLTQDDGYLPRGLSTLLEEILVAVRKAYPPWSVCINIYIVRDTGAGSIIGPGGSVKSENIAGNSILGA
jgi:hypothetical protein